MSSASSPKRRKTSSADPVRVFISYRSQDPDQSLAKDFYAALQAAGHEVFMAAESYIAPGTANFAMAARGVADLQTLFFKHAPKCDRPHPL